VDAEKEEISQPERFEEYFKRHIKNNPYTIEFARMCDTNLKEWIDTQLQLLNQNDMMFALLSVGTKILKSLIKDIDREKARILSKKLTQIAYDIYDDDNKNMYLLIREILDKI